MKKNNLFTEFVEDRDIENPHFEVGQLFSSSTEFKEAVDQYFIVHRKNFTFSTNEKWRVRVKCKPPCKWMIYALGENKLFKNLQVKSYNPKHKNCKHGTNNMFLIANWIGHRYQSQFASNPDIPYQSLREMIKKEQNDYF